MGGVLILRDYQRKFVDRCVSALNEHDNTLGVAPTGSGKTVILSSVTDDMLTSVGRAMVVAHREELIHQNRATFKKFCPDRPTSIYNGQTKSWDGQVTFGSIQTLCRQEHLEKIPHISFLVYDEAHHCKSESYERLTNYLKEKNPDIKILGVTATPERGDKKGLKPTFDNVADVIQLPDMIIKGHLVEPVGKHINLGLDDQLRAVSTGKNDFADQSAVADIMNTQATNNAIVREWRKYAGDRQSVFFCATIDHAIEVANVFQESNINAVPVHSNLSRKERADRLSAFNSCEVQVLTNPMLLTEGWDSPICSCVGLLRACSFKSTMTQMAGRGLRKNPHGIKKDCIILDFGISLATHGDLFAKIILDGVEAKGVAPQKLCPGCGTMIPAACIECPICGHVFEIEEKEKSVIEQFTMKDIDLINRSPFRWISLFPGDRVMIANGFDAWAGVCSPDGENWFAIGGRSGAGPSLLSISNRIGAVASADDWMREYETSSSAKKASRWMNQPATSKQNQILSKYGYQTTGWREKMGVDLIGGMSKIQAAAHLTFRFNQRHIERILNV